MSDGYADKLSMFVLGQVYDVNTGHIRVTLRRKADGWHVVFALPNQDDYWGLGYVLPQQEMRLGEFLQRVESTFGLDLADAA